MRIALTGVVHRLGLEIQRRFAALHVESTELCSCVTIQLPSTLRKQTVARHHISIFFPSLVVPFTLLRLWQKIAERKRADSRLYYLGSQDPWVAKRAAANRTVIHHLPVAIPGTGGDLEDNHFGGQRWLVLVRRSATWRLLCSGVRA
jgi:hypothetical protein